jgi:hypothetical protein
VRIDETVDAIELYYAQGWTGGPPAVAPTRAKVRAIVERSGRAASEVSAGLPSRGGKATVQHPRAALAPEAMLQRADTVVERIVPS